MKKLDLSLAKFIDICLLINIVNFVLLSLVKLGYFSTCPGKWMGEIKNNDQLSPAEAETRAELGKIIFIQLVD